MKLVSLFYHWVVPHSGNNHRAKALHHDALFAYVLLFLVFNLGVRVFHKELPAILGFATDIRVEELLASTNAKRIEAGKGTLSLNPTLSHAAAAKANDMFTYNYWAHNSPSGKTPWDFIVGSGYTYTLAGENLAKNFANSGGVVDAWMASPTHRDNILKGGYQDVGFAIVNGVLNGEETTVVVQMFGATNTKTIAKIPQVQAVEPQAELIKTIVPESAVQAPVVQPYMSAKVTPKINITTLSREVVYIFILILLAVLALDAIIVSRKRIVRMVGHNIAHIVFLLSIVGYSLFIIRGNLL